ncbi:MAG: long-chain-fatty-acid--CoA ligase FadD [Gammaproteobacteria bacterium]|nr:MAG: long-chain-fatty-acid--CoA ligase FadD [Gammaproteobacteria bacterium]
MDNDAQAIAAARNWLDRYPDNVPHEINPDEYRSLLDMFEQSIVRFADKPAFSNLGRTLSYAEVDQLTRDFAAFLQKRLGLEQGDRIALMMPNLLQFPVAMFGAMRAGLVIVNTNPLYTERELEHQMSDSGAKAIVVLENFAHMVEKVYGKTSLNHVIVTGAGDMLNIPKRWLVNFVLRYVRRQVPSYKIPGSTRLRAALVHGRLLKLDPVAPGPNDIAMLQYTGGTTGLSKGAVLTHRNLIANMLQLRAWLGVRLVEGEEVVITALPLYHIFSLTCNCLLFMSLGGLNVLITNPRDMNAFLGEMKNWPFTALTGVSTLFNLMLNHSLFKEIDFSHLRLAVGGGMSLQESVAGRWAEITGGFILEGYGLTEASPVVCANPYTITGYTGAIGLPLPSTEVTLRDDDGKEAVTGELWVRGPQVMQGYWNREDATTDTITSDGWLKTGDIAAWNDQGFLAIVDRKKDMIVVSGFNVYPNEVENVLMMHEGILEAACVGVPDERSGEAVKVFVVLKPGVELEARDIKEHCKQQLTGYKVPRQVEFRDELPKTNVGKILRRALREPDAKL